MSFAISQSFNPLFAHNIASSAPIPDQALTHLEVKTENFKNICQSILKNSSDIISNVDNVRYYASMGFESASYIFSEKTNGTNNKVSDVSSKILGTLNSLCKTVILKEAYNKLITCLKYGNLQDKFHGFKDLLDAVLNFVSSLLDTLSRVSPELLKPLAALPILLLNVISSGLELIKALNGLVKSYLLGYRFNEMFVTENEEEKIKLILNDFKAFEASIDEANAYIREQNIQNKELESFLSDRKKSIITQKYGQEIYEMIFLIKDESSLLDTLMQDFTVINEKLEVFDDPLKNQQLEVLKNQLIDQSLFLVEKVQSQLNQNLTDSIYRFLSSVFGVAYNLLPLLLPNLSMPITSMLLNFSWQTLSFVPSITSYLYTPSISENEKSWIRHLVVKAVADGLRNCDNKLGYAQQYGFISELDPVINEKTFISEFKSFINEKLKTKTFNKKIKSGLVAKLKKLNKSDLPITLALNNQFGRLVSSIKESQNIDASLAVQRISFQDFHQFLNKLKRSNALKGLVFNKSRELDQVHRRILAA